MKPHQNSTKQHQQAHQNDSQPTETAIIDRLRTCRAVTGTPGTAQERLEPAHDTPPALPNPRTIGSQSQTTTAPPKPEAAEAIAKLPPRHELATAQPEPGTTAAHNRRTHGARVAK